MVKAPSPLLGFNNNVRHKGRVFHIQTEDSGIRHPHIITHLFADGGRILKTTKTSYAEHVGHDRLAETVRGMMQEQHKAMFIALRDGQYDYLFDENAPPPSQAVPSPDGNKPRKPAAPGGLASEPSTAAQPAVAQPEPAPAAPAPAPPEPPPPPSPPAAAPPPKAQAFPHATGYRTTGPRPPEEPPPEAHVAPPPRPPPAAPPPRPPTAAPPPPPRAAPPPPAAVQADAQKRAAPRPRLDMDPGAIHGAPAAGASDGREASIDLDLDALERAAAEAQTPFFQQIQDLPPPPAAVLGNRRTATGGGYSVRAAADAAAPGAPASPGRYVNDHTPPRRAPTPPTPPTQISTPGRYAPSRPASIFATTRPQEGSLFGENLISEKSLDEVILSYLADDLDAPDKK